MKRSVMIIGMTVLLIILLFAGTAVAESGTYDGISWDLTDGVLTLGNGDIQTITDDESRNSASWPWMNLRDSITSVRCDGTLVMQGSIGGMFVGLSNATSIDLTGMQTARVMDFSNMFYDDEVLETLILPNSFVTSYATSTGYMFNQCLKLPSVDVTGWDVSNVTTMRAMFAGCKALTDMDLTDWDVSKVVDFRSMFHNCTGLITLDLSGWDVSHGMQFDDMFWTCTSLTTLNITGWNTSSATDFSRMFYDCRNVQALDLSGFDLTHVTDVASMFYNDRFSRVELGTYELKNDDVIMRFSTPETSYRGFYYTGKWIKEDGSYGPYTSDELSDAYTSDMAGSWIWEKEVPLGYAVYVETDETLYFVVSDSTDIYQSGSQQTIHSISGQDYAGVVYPVVNGYYPWSEQKNVVKHVIFVDGMSPTTTKNWFSQFSVCTSIDIEKLDTSQVTDMSNMFSICSVLSDLDVSNFDTSNVITMQSMFSTCWALPSVDVSGWDTGNVTSMYGMFAGCSSFESLDLSTFDMHSVTTIANMFGSNGYTAHPVTLDVLDLTDWDVSNVTNMSSAFGGSVIGTLDLTGWDVSNVVSADSMFNGFTGHLIAPNLAWTKLGDRYGRVSNMFYSVNVGSILDIPRWSFGNLRSTYYMFACDGNVTVDASDWNLDGVTSISDMCRLAGGTWNLSGWHSDTATSASSMFAYGGPRNVDVSNWDMPILQFTYDMFAACHNVQIAGLETWDVSSLIDASSMFYLCDSLIDVDFSNWNAPLLSNTSSMFYCCSSIKSIDFGNLTATNLTNTGNMFYACTSLEYVNIAGFDRSNVTSGGSEFTGDTNLRKVVLGGTNFWETATYPYSTSSALPTPPAEEGDVPYTGKWIREDGVYGPYTPNELLTAYTGAMEGTWIWEKVPLAYDIIFEAPDGAFGYMEPVTVEDMRKPYQLPKCLYNNPRWEFVGWIDEYRAEYIDEDIIPSNTFAAGTVLHLKAVFNELSREAQMEDGTLTFTLRGGWSALFDNLPAGIQYQLYEETPYGWILIGEDQTAGSIIPLEEKSGLFVNQYQDDVLTLQFIGEKQLDEQLVAAGDYQFELLDENGTVLQTVSTLDSGVISFAPMQYSSADIGQEYDYIIREVISGTDTVDYDVHEEHVKVRIGYLLDGEEPEPFEATTVISHTENLNDDGSQIDLIDHSRDNERITVIGHTDNVDDDGVKQGDYESNQIYSSILSIPDAASLHVTVQYSNPRGNFYIWKGSHNEVTTGNWSSDCNTSTGNRGSYYKLYNWQSGKDHELMTDEFDVDGGSISVYYKSQAFLESQGIYPNGPYSDITDYGYYVTVTATSYYRLDAKRNDGSYISDYVSYKYYPDIITIPGAMRLRVEVTYTNPRGYFVLFEGVHDEVNTRYWTSDIQPSSNVALRYYTYQNGKDQELMHDVFTVDSDSISLLWYSSAYYPSQGYFPYGPYSDITNYGYYIKVTPVIMADVPSAVSHSQNLRDDGTYSYYLDRYGGRKTEVVTIPGAKSLVVNIKYGLDPEDWVCVWAGNRPQYTAQDNYGSSLSGKLTGLSHTSPDNRKTYKIYGDTVTFSYYAPVKNRRTADGYGYYATVKAMPEVTLTSDVEYDRDGIKFFNETKPGVLRLTKEGEDMSDGDSIFYYEIQFVTDGGIACDPEDVSGIDYMIVDP